jgi:uncharacterized membrane protein (DUF2068 family)
MTPQDHNKTLAMLYGIIGVLALTGLTFIVIRQIDKLPPSDMSQTTQHVALLAAIKNTGPALSLLLPPLLQLVTGYGLFMKRRWGRVIALISSAFFVFVVPLGTGLAIYTWWFLHSKGAVQLYFRSSDEQTLVP